jgi:hypothetical protein
MLLARKERRESEDMKKKVRWLMTDGRGTMDDER